MISRRWALLVLLLVVPATLVRALPEPSSRRHTRSVPAPQGRPEAPPTNLTGPEGLIAKAKDDAVIKALLAKTPIMSRADADTLYKELSDIWGNFSYAGWTTFVNGVLDTIPATNKAVVKAYIDQRKKGILGTPIDTLVADKNSSDETKKNVAQWEWDRRVEELTPQINYLKMRVDEAVALQYYAALASAPEAKLTPAQKTERSSVAFVAIAMALRRQDPSKLDDVKAWLTTHAGKAETSDDAKAMATTLANAIIGFKTSPPPANPNKAWDDPAQQQYEVAMAQKQYLDSRQASGSRPHQLLLAGYDVQENGKKLVPKEGPAAAAARLQLAREFGDDIAGAFGDMHATTSATFPTTGGNVTIENLGHVYRAAVLFASNEVTGETRTGTFRATGPGGQPIDVSFTAPNKGTIVVADAAAVMGALGSRGLAPGTAQTFANAGWNNITSDRVSYDSRDPIRQSAITVRRQNAGYRALSYGPPNPGEPPSLIETTFGGPPANPNKRTRTWTTPAGSFTETATGTTGNWTPSETRLTSRSGNTQTTVVSALQANRPTTITTTVATVNPTGPPTTTSTTVESRTYPSGVGLDPSGATVRVTTGGTTTTTTYTYANYTGGVLTRRTRQVTRKVGDGAPTTYTEVWNRERRVWVVDA